MSDSTFAGKLAIVTGASKQNGIGFATAYSLAKAGADVVIHYNSNGAAAQESAAKLQALGIKVATVQADATSLSFGDDIVKATLKAFPNRSIDIIINNAGAATFQEGVAKAPIEDFDLLFHVNVRAPHLLIRAALPHLAAPGGRIVNVGTVVARQGSRFAAFYSSSKAALNNLTLAWAEELGPKGITANVVAPGPIETDLAAPEEHELVKGFRVNQSVKRNGTPEEVASAIVYLSTPASAFVTGQVLAADGGITYV